MLDKLFWEVDYFPSLVGSNGGIDHRDNASVLGLIVQFRQVLACLSKSSAQPFDLVGRVKIQRVKSVIA
jgi:hypothetical protein